MGAGDIAPLSHHRHIMLSARAVGEGQIKGGGKAPFAFVVHQIGMLANMVVSVMRKDIEDHAAKGLLDVAHIASDR